MEFSDFDGDGIDDMLFIAEGRNVFTSQTDRFSVLVSSRQLIEGWSGLLQDLLLEHQAVFVFVRHRQRGLARQSGPGQ